ncbi:MAG: ATP-binding protein [Methermicoccaceae archaeon]
MMREGANDQTSKLDVVELLLTCECYNMHTELDARDLPSPIRRHYWDVNAGGVPRPMFASERHIKDIYGTSSVKEICSQLPFVEYTEFGGQVNLTVMELAMDWFIKNGGLERIAGNPAIAYHCEKAGVRGTEGISYSESLKSVPPLHSERVWIKSMLAELRAKYKDEAEEMLKLCTVSAPEEITMSLDDLVLTPDQHGVISKMMSAIENRGYLAEIGLYDVGKMLFVGAPGTGKTSTARALSRRLGLPFLEVRLSMVTNQYLGETSKNIDRVFELAKRLSPCILFIDEFDFVAKTRTSDEHAALKRAVNTLLKAIDEISLVRHGVLLIGATNHPQLLDVAAWRRFDEVVRFSLPDEEMRREILEKITHKIAGHFDVGKIASMTEGFSGSDLRVVVREAVLSSLREGRRELTQDDLVRAVEEFTKRESTKAGMEGVEDVA